MNDWDFNLSMCVSGLQNLLIVGLFIAMLRVFVKAGDFLK
jgi:hypothetical protein